MSSRPLHSKRILLTRAAGQSAKLRALLEERGAEILEIPLIELVPLHKPALDEALKRLNEYDWILFTSRNAVRFFFDVLGRSKGPPTPSALGTTAAPKRGDLPAGIRSPALARFAVVGPGTAEALRASGVEPSLVASKHQAEGLLSDLEAAIQSGIGRSQPAGRHDAGAGELPERQVAAGKTAPLRFEGIRFLLPQAARARDYLARELRARGGEVDVVELYDTVAPESSRLPLRGLLRDHPPDLIVLTSSSAAQHLRDLVDPALATRSPVACIGEVTARTAAECGLRVAATARESSLEGLAEAVVTFLARPPA